LNPRDVFRALAGKGTIIPHVSAHVPFALPGVLRAARDLDSVLSISGAAARRAMGHEVQVPAPYAQFNSVIEAAAEAVTERPLMLVGTLPVDSTDERTVATSREIVFKFVDAGFTGISIRPGGDPADVVAQLALDIAGPVRERELTLEIGLVGAGDHERVPGLAKALRARGITADAFTVTFDRETVPVSIDKLARAVQPSVIAGRGSVDPREFLSLAAAGLRRMDLTRPLFEIAERSLPESLVAQIKSQPDLGPALAAHASAIAEAVRPERRERIEALAYAETLELVRALGAQGSASIAAHFLAAGSGY
jgi:hypothetical protein